VNALSGTVTNPAWQAKPSWYLLTTEDKMTSPAAQRSMAERAEATVTEIAASHSVYISQPAAVAGLIAQARV
jgi:pimeloyl-ACP methyl ester carboxylesterase